HGAPYQIPAFSAQEHDPTGAGDVFAAALLLRLYETHDPIHSALFASAAAACAVEGPGVVAIPTRDHVLARMR
ncbi:MAG: ribokinase, partial [Oscillochloris sp.]|nr:ribokinase [Oscillochloris sp.]